MVGLGRVQRSVQLLAGPLWLTTALVNNPFVAMGGEQWWICIFMCGFYPICFTLLHHMLFALVIKCMPISLTTLVFMLFQLLVLVYNTDKIN